MSNDPIQEYLEKQNQGSKDAIDAYVQRQSNKSTIDQSSQKNKSAMNIDNDILNKSLSQNHNLQSVNKYAAIPGAIGLGGAQGIYNTGKSIADIPFELSGSNFRLPQGNLQKYLPQDPYTRTAFEVGQLGGEITGGGGVYGAIGKALKLGAETPMMARALQGAITGYATGEESPGGRGLSATVGGVLGGTGQLTNKALAERLASIKAREEATGSNKFNDVFKEIKEKGLENLQLKKPNIDMDYMKKILGDKYKGAVTRFEDDPTIENAHKLQSDLGGMMRDIKKKAPEVTSTQREAYGDIKNAQKRMRGSIYSELERAGNRNIANNYQGAINYFRENVIPYRTKALEQQAKGELKPNKVINRTLSNDKFMLKKGDYINELKAREKINNLMKNQLNKIIFGSALGSLGTLGAYDLVKGK